MAFDPVLDPHCLCYPRAAGALKTLLKPGCGLGGAQGISLAHSFEFSFYFLSQNEFWGPVVFSGYLFLHFLYYLYMVEAKGVDLMVNSLSSLQKVIFMYSLRKTK